MFCWYSTIIKNLAHGESLHVHCDGVSQLLEEVANGLWSHFLVDGIFILESVDEGKDAFFTNLLAEITVNATREILK